MPLLLRPKLHMGPVRPTLRRADFHDPGVLAWQVSALGLASILRSGCDQSPLDGTGPPVPCVDVAGERTEP